MTIWNMEITAAESPQTVHIPLEGKYYAIKNSGEHDILVSSYVANPTEGADDVMKIPSGSAAVIPVKDGDLYVSSEEDGTYSVSIQDDKVLPWGGGTGSGGGSSDNTHYKGTTTTPLENGSTTNPIVIDGESYTAVFGDVVVYGYTEFVFDGTTWSEFGRPFDTTPTQGSTNAVTSDGIYMCTPWGRHTTSSGAQMGVSASAPGSTSLAVGYHSTSRGTSSLALGYYASTTSDANYSAAIGNYTQVTNSSMLAIGKYNSPRTGDLFNIGNGSSSTRSNIVEVNRTEMNVNGDIKINNIAIPTPYTTMPTITADMLGKIAQYVGETTNNYVKGYFYIASSDGAAQPTYSWQALMDTTPTSGSTNAVTSDGIYAVTPFVRGSNNEKTAVLAGTGCFATTSGSVAVGFNTGAYGGDQAFACGNGTRASNSNAFAAGYQSQASGFASASFGTSTYTTQTAQMAVGVRNNPLADDLFEVGNGSAARRSNIFEVSRSHANVNGDIQINGINIPTPYTTMPTITADMLGKIAMYVGTTGGEYVQGCFYVASTDGAAEPTYSWVQIGGYREIELYSNNEHAATPVDTVITLSQDWAEFDAIGFVSEYNDEVGLCAYNEYKVSVISAISNKIVLNFNIGANSNSAIFLRKNTSNSFVVNSISAPSGGLSHVYKIIGIKY